MKHVSIFGGLIAIALSAPAIAQEQGEAYVKLAAARTKLVDKGEVRSDGVLDPEAAYQTREAYHAALTAGYFLIDGVAVEGSISTPATTNNIPAGSLGGLPNLGDDEFVLATLGASIQPFKGRVRPYVGGGIALQITTQERDGLAVDLDIPTAHGPYVNAGVNVGLNDRLDLFVDARKAWYSTNATGLLPLDATFTNFAAVDANAVLDPLTIQLGLGVRFGGDRADRGANSAPKSGDAGRFTVKVGYTNLSLADKLELEVGGAPFPGAGLSTFEHQTVSAQLGYFFTDNIAVNATVGFPPTIDIFGAGTIGALPMLGSVTYGPAVATVQFHPVRKGPIQPYVGVGVAHMFVFDTEDGAFGDLEVGEDTGFAFELGVNMPVNDKFGVFFDAKRAYLRPVSTGTFMGMDVRGETKLDPWAFTGGVSFNF